jgi:hypothetical protein
VAAATKPLIYVSSRAVLTEENQCPHAVCGNAFGLADSMYISQLASRVGEGRRSLQMLPSAIPTCHRGQEVA